jgi:hypothetical protein
MKLRPTTTIFPLATLILIMGAASAQAHTPAAPEPVTTATDITINNGQGTSASDYSAISASDTNADPRKGVYDLGYVNAGDVANKSWDLEAFGYTSTPSTKSLTYVGGFDPLTQNQGVSLGDIFISPGSVTQPAGLKANSDYSNPGYTYAIHITGVNLKTSTLTYSIYQLAVNTQLQTVEFTQNLDSDPYALDLSNLGGAKLLVSGLTATVAEETGSQVDSLLNEQLFDTTSDKASDSNYVVSFNITSLDLSAFTASLTEQCGNDDLKGAFSAPLTPLPEPSSWLMALLVLGTLAYLRLGRREAGPENEMASYMEA